MGSGGRWLARRGRRSCPWTPCGRGVQRALGFRLGLAGPEPRGTACWSQLGVCPPPPPQEQDESSRRSLLCEPCSPTSAGASETRWGRVPSRLSTQGALYLGVGVTFRCKWATPRNSGLAGENRPKAFILCLLGAHMHLGTARAAGSAGTLSPVTFSSGGASVRHAG